jgi:ACS family D-galactonate transporter-like MFS transporter
MNKVQNDNYRWYIMILGMLTNAVSAAIPIMGLSVLLPEISKDLDLNLVQAGMVWGISSLSMLFAGFLAGSLCDRFGPKRILTISCLLVGLAGASRGLSMGFPALMITALIFGFFTTVVTLSNFKIAVIWFPPGELAIANGLATLGMATGFFVGSMISAAYLSPALGGWRNVLFFFGATSALFSIPWILTRPSPGASPVAGESSHTPTFRKSLLSLAKLKNMWLISLAAMGFSGGNQGTLGYLPLYLQDRGWSVANAGSVMASFHIASMITVVPLAFFSDRLGSRRKFLIGAALLSTTGISLLSFVNGGAVWVAAMMTGCVRDGFMAIILTLINEIPGVKNEYSGMATGFMMSFMGLGNLLAPPVGNSLANGTRAGAPLIFWGALILFGGLCAFFASSRKHVHADLQRTELEGL